MSEITSFAFYTGTHKPHWLARAYFPLFISRRQLRTVKRKFPRAAARWALDSGAFMEIADHGAWTVTPREYAADVRFWRDTIGNLDWASIQDWMCEPAMLKRTGKSIREHQELTTANYLELRSIAPDLPFIPILQGWSHDDYRRHADAYYSAGVELERLPIVGIGSMCKRQHKDLDAAKAIIREFAGAGLKLHAFGFKLTGIKALHRHLASADSMAWSFDARYADKHLALCRHPKCNNCIAFAAKFRDQILRECVGAYDICPECGNDQINGPDHGNYSRSCAECGFSWPEHLSGSLDGFEACKHQEIACQT